MDRMATARCCVVPGEVTRQKACPWVTRLPCVDRWALRLAELEAQIRLQKRPWSSSRSTHRTCKTDRARSRRSTRACCSSCRLLPASTRPVVSCRSMRRTFPSCRRSRFVRLGEPPFPSRGEGFVFRVALPGSPTRCTSLVKAGLTPAGTQLEQGLWMVAGRQARIGVQNT